MFEINKELLEKVKNSGDLRALAKENGIDLTEKEAETYFAKFNIKTGELDDDELDDVAGGRKCGTTYKDSRPVVAFYNSCEYFTTKDTGVRWANGGKCQECLHMKGASLPFGFALCYCPERYDN